MLSCNTVVMCKPCEIMLFDAILLFLYVVPIIFMHCAYNYAHDCDYYANDCTILHVHCGDLVLLLPKP